MIKFIKIFIFDYIFLKIVFKLRKFLGYRSDGFQDIFVNFITGFKEDGNYIDVGSCHAEISNNSFYFANKGWRGICVENNSNYFKSYDFRPNTILIQQNALLVDWKKLIELVFGSEEIDFLSIDIDEKSTELLSRFPFTLFRPKVITIEHDRYRFGNIYAESQRKVLKENKYSLLCADVQIQLPGSKLNGLPFEDWWVDATFLKNRITVSTMSEVNPIKVIFTLRFGQFKKKIKKLKSNFKFNLE